MKSLLLLTTLTPLLLQSMEPEERTLPETSTQEFVGAHVSGGYRWAKLLDVQLNGNFEEMPLITRQSITQEILRRKPTIKKVILSQIALSVKSLGHSDNVIYAKFGLNDDTIITVSKDGLVTIWQTTSGDVLQAFSVHASAIMSVDCNFAGGTIMILPHNGSCAVWDISNGQLLYTLEDVIKANFNPAGTQLVSGHRDGKVKLWDAANGNLLRVIDAHRGRITSIRFNREGNRIATASLSAKIWDETGNPLCTLGDSRELVTIIGFNPSSTRLVTTLGDETILIWDINNRELLHRFEIMPLSISLKDHRLLLGGNGIRIYDVETGSLLLSLPNQETGACSPIGDIIVCVSEGAVRAYSQTGSLLLMLKKSEGEESYQPSPRFNDLGDKVLVVLGSLVKMWDLEPLLLVSRFLEEDCTLRQLALLVDLYEVMVARDYAKLNAPTMLAEEQEQLMNLTFDFNRYPGLWPDYQALPELMRNVFDRYILPPVTE